MCETVSPSYSLFPVSISHRTTPNDQISARLSTGFPLACSGLMYPAVPMIIPACVARMVSVGELVGLPSPGLDVWPTAASPKSSTFTTPSGVIMMLAGFRSRCVMFFSWAASIPSINC